MGKGGKELINTYDCFLYLNVRYPFHSKSSKSWLFVSMADGC